MSERDQQSAAEASTLAAPRAAGAQPRFSLERLSSAFARLMGATSAAARHAQASPQVAVVAEEAMVDDVALPVTPRMIVEGMLFVGDAQGRPLTARQIASHIRDVTPAEVDELVAQLNETYRTDGAAYEIVAQGGGYQMRLRSDLAGVRERFRGRIRTARLTPQAIEVLSIVAYRPGVTVEELNRLRSAQSYAILSQLVRRELVRAERPKESPRVARYYTTARFNQLFGVSSPAELPRAEELADA
ncbi:MAG: hypothetical protein DCC67_12655 [Planctomycetota bacterium]|nr:MAG: hypothetical protein DCC67_12655 [Planctomycetota bacterium]